MALTRSIGAAYDGTLGTTPLDARRALAAMLAPAAGGAARPGVFPGAAAVLVAGYATGWNYQIAAGGADFATTRGAADGAHIFGCSGGELVATIAAPGTAGASRIDIVYVLHPSKGENSDSSSTPVFATANGGATTGTPQPPVLPSGALELFRNTITSAATSTLSAGNTPSQTWRYTALAGAPITVRNQAERDELTALATAAHPIVVDRLDTGTMQRNAGSAWVTIARPLGVGQSRAETTSASGTITIAHGLTSTPVAIVLTAAGFGGTDVFEFRVESRSATNANIVVYRNNTIATNFTFGAGYGFDWIAVGA